MNPLDMAVLLREQQKDQQMCVHCQIVEACKRATLSVYEAEPV